MKRCCWVLFVYVVVFYSSNAQTLELTIENIRDKAGILRLVLFANETEFDKEKPSWEAAYDKQSLTGSIFHLKIELTPGTYALSVLDDTNGNGRMEYSFLGFPREGFGFSNFVQKGIRKPRFTDFCFTIKKEEILPITVYMKYF